MIIKASEIKGTDVEAVIDELYAMPDVMEFVRGYNLPAFDVIEAMATKIVYDDADINTDDYIDNKNISLSEIEEIALKISTPRTDGNGEDNKFNWMYCTQNDRKCDSCSLSNYGRDCKNNKILVNDIDRK